VYVISAEGGEPSTSPFIPGTTSSSVGRQTAKTSLPSDRFSAPPGRYTKLFLVSPQVVGEAAPGSARQPDYFFADGTKIAYLETSQEFRTWKRYRGGWSLPIAIFDLKKNSYEELRDCRHGPLPDVHGNTIYFISDRDGVMNLFSYDLGSKQTKKLTDYKEFDISGRARPTPSFTKWRCASRIQSRHRKNAQSPIVVHAEDVEARPEFKKRRAIHRQLFAFSVGSSRPGGSPR